MHSIQYHNFPAYFVTAESFHFRVPGLSIEIFLVVIERSLIMMGQLIRKTFEESPVTMLMTVELHPYWVLYIHIKIGTTNTYNLQAMNMLDVFRTFLQSVFKKFMLNIWRCWWGTITNSSICAGKCIYR